MSGSTLEMPIPAPQQRAPAESTALPQRLRVELLHLDEGTQARAAINEAVIQEYSEAMQAGAIFPPVVAFFDGQVYWLADGFHRLRAAIACGRDEFDVDLRQGTREDAVWFACSANRAHGLRRSNADKRRAVTMALASPKAQGMSDRQLAEHCGVGHVFIGMVRRELAGVHGEHLAAAEVRTGRDGKQYGPELRQARSGRQGVGPEARGPEGPERRHHHATTRAAERTGSDRNRAGAAAAARPPGAALFGATTAGLGAFRSPSARRGSDAIQSAPAEDAAAARPRGVSDAVSRRATCIPSPREVAPQEGSCAIAAGTGGSRSWRMTGMTAAARRRSNALILSPSARSRC